MSSYPHLSELYLTLSEDDDGEIAVTDDCFKPDSVVNHAASFRHLVSTLRFLIVHDISDEIYQYFRTKTFYEETARTFYDDIPCFENTSRFQVETGRALQSRHYWKLGERKVHI